MTAVLVTMCRDCCCATPTKHPGIDHDALLEQLRTGTSGRARVRISRCVDACDQSNVVIINPSPAGRRAGATPVWLGLVLTPEAVQDVITWVRSGGPGMAEPPPTLDLYRFTPRHRAR